MDRRAERRIQQRYPRRGPSHSPGRRRTLDPERPDSSEMYDGSEINLGTIAEFLKNNWMVVTIVLIGISLRIMLLNHESFWIDEAMTGLRSRWDFEYMIKEVSGRDQMPLYFIFTWLVAKTFGNSVLVLRGLSAIFGVLAFIPIYRIGKRFNREAALIALLLFSFSPTMIYYSQEARMYMLMVLLSASSVYLYLEFLNPLKMRRMTAGVMMLAFNVTLIYIHYFGVLFVGFELLAMFSVLIARSIKLKEGIRLKENVQRCWPLLLSLLSFIPWLIYQQMRYSISEKSTGGSLGFGIGLIPETFRFIGGQYTAVFKYDTNTALITGYIFMFALLLSVIYLILKRNKDQDMVSLLVLGLFMILLSPLLVLFISHNLTPMYNHRYFIFMAVPFFLFISLALSEIHGSRIKKNISRPPVVLLLVGFLILPSMVTDLDQLSQRDKADWKGGIDLILENHEEGDVVVPFPDYEQMVIYYYTDELDIELMGLVEDLHQFLNDHYRVWIIFYEVEPIDEQPLVRDLNAWHMEEYRVEEITVRLYVKHSST